MRFAIVFLSSVALAIAQSLTVNTPINPIGCVNQQVTWTGGTGPFILQVNAYPPSNGQQPLNSYSGISGSPFTWLVEQSPNTSVFIRLRDSSGLTAETGQINIVAGGPATCAPGSSSSGAATTPGSSAPPASSTPVDSSSAPGGTTAAPSSSGGSTTSTRSASSSSTSSHSGAASVKVAGASVVGFAGLVAAAVLA